MCAMKAKQYCNESEAKRSKAKQSKQGKPQLHRSKTSNCPWQPKDHSVGLLSIPPRALAMLKRGSCVRHHCYHNP